MSRRLFISFSGGETSAFMTWWVLNNWKDRYDEMAVVFANTGEENEETLLFVALCAYHWNIPVVWVEAEIHHGERKNPTARIVDYATASRKGEPFEEMIRKYGIPNTKFKHCTRTLKLRPMEDYIRRHLGWAAGTYETAIGIRTDELDRISSKKKEHRIVYPLADVKPMRKSEDMRAIANGAGKRVSASILRYWPSTPTTTNFQNAWSESMDWSEPSSCMTLQPVAARYRQATRRRRSNCRGHFQTRR